jgi:hypothetical protein
MSFFDFFKSSSTANSNGRILRTRPTDAFADSILLELKSVAADAIKNALEERENKYMKSILDESYFLLDSLIIIPKDREIAKRFDEFLSTHESVDTDFRHHFFQQVLQREYRSLRGGTVRVPSDFSATVQFGQTSLESMTTDEEFQISLKGRRIQFEAQASLTGPMKRETTVLQDKFMASEPHFTAPSSAATSTPSPITPVASRALGRKLQIKLLDANGVSMHTLKLPAIIGRDGPSSDTKLDGWQSLQVNSTYVSRQQLAIVELMGECYFYVPDSASLTCMRSDNSVLEHLKLYKLANHHRESLNFGIDPTSPSHVAPQGSIAEYGTIEISVAEELPEIDTSGTPRPRAV